MKTLLLIAILLVSSLSITNAQQGSIRCISRADSIINVSPSMGPLDTANYYYSNGRGSDVKAQIFNCDSMCLVEDTIHGLNGIDTLNEYIELKTFDTSNNILSFTQRWDWISTSNVTASSQGRRSFYSYDQHNNQVQEILQFYTFYTPGVLSNSNKDSTAYDANNNKIFDRSLSWNFQGSYWHGDNQSFYTYTNNKLTSVLAQYENGNGAIWYNDKKYDYAWNGNLMTSWKTTEYGTFAPGTSSTVGKDSFIYDAAGHLVSTIESELNVTTGIWDTLRKIDAVWVNNNKILQFTVGWSAVFHSWSTLFDRDSTVYDNSHNPIYDELSEWDTISHSYISDTRNMTTYNLWGQPTLVIRQLWDNTAHQWQYKYAGGPAWTRYHYEEYIPVSVNKTVFSSLNLAVYPNPASSYIQLSMHYDRPVPFTIAIYDVKGRLIMQQSERAATEFNKTIPLLHMASGNYILSVAGKDFLETKQFTVL